jgi:ankyrin repeat protein
MKPDSTKPDNDSAHSGSVLSRRAAPAGTARSWARVGDPLLEAVLLDDDVALRGAGDLTRKLSPLCAYTCCDGVTALHICAEFNSVRCAKVLIDAGADVNAAADVDADGLGGQTPLFHAVNSNQNYCRPVMELLVDAGADLDLRLKGLVWGKTMPWETVLFDVTLFSYAQCGLYRQFHRREEDVYSNLDYLYLKRFGARAPIRNVPNRYLAS